MIVIVVIVVVAVIIIVYMNTPTFVGSCCFSSYISIIVVFKGQIDSEMILIIF